MERYGTDGRRLQAPPRKKKRGKRKKKAAPAGYRTLAERMLGGE